MDEKTIREWSYSPDRTTRVAADLAKRIQSGRYRQYSQLPPNEDLASEYCVSIATLLRAKRMLAGHHMLAKDDSNVYIVA